MRYLSIKFLLAQWVTYVAAVVEKDEGAVSEVEEWYVGSDWCQY